MSDMAVCAFFCPRDGKEPHRPSPPAPSLPGFLFLFSFSFSLVVVVGGDLLLWRPSLNPPPPPEGDRESSSIHETVQRISLSLSLSLSLWDSFTFLFELRAHGRGKRAQREEKAGGAGAGGGEETRRGDQGADWREGKMAAGVGHSPVRGCPSRLAGLAGWRGRSGGQRGAGERGGGGVLLLPSSEHSSTASGTNVC